MLNCCWESGQESWVIENSNICPNSWNQFLESRPILNLSVRYQVPIIPLNLTFSRPFYHSTLHLHYSEFWPLIFCLIHTTPFSCCYRWQSYLACTRLKLQPYTTVLSAQNLPKFPLPYFRPVSLVVMCTGPLVNCLIIAVTIPPTMTLCRVFSLDLDAGDRWVSILVSLAVPQPYTAVPLQLFAPFPNFVANSGLRALL